MNTNHYTTLSIRKDATPEQVRDAYILLARQHHPDTGGNAATFQDINTAYSVLRVPSRRAHYDKEQTLLHGACVTCGGAGYTERARGMRGVVRADCAECNGTGTRQ